MLKFKDIFPNLENFKAFVHDYKFYYGEDEYTDARVVIYYSLLYRNFANSHTAYDNEIFYEQLSLTLEENFREFFIARELLEYIASQEVKELLIGLETINNVAENPNIVTDKDTIVNYIGAQTRGRTKENIVDRVYSLIPKLRVQEVKNECKKYDHLFLKIIPRTYYLYEEEEE